ncbi:MAG TPA: Eco29kI family restriction endonuclease [Roseiflexaceae bacterium]|nr:Eco29kI family restriction endonuclease [Roseiflexaceae bacterium]
MTLSDKSNPAGSSARPAFPDEKPYDPLAYDNLGHSISQAVLQRATVPMSSLPSFNGAGIYAIYYTGIHMPYPAYTALADAHSTAQFSRPIYVGKAEPSGARKGKRDTLVIGMPLAKRLSDHVKSIRAASSTLSIDDFHCRYLVVEPVWIPLGESILINLTNPLWNVVVEGFGNHDPGKGRLSGVRPMWDTIHPGRPWAVKLPDRSEAVAEINNRITRFLGGDPSARLPEEAQEREADTDSDTPHTNVS